MSKLAIPKGLIPPDWVYFCWTPAMNFVMYSTETGSSMVSRWDWHSTRALSIRIRASAVSPVQPILCYLGRFSDQKYCSYLYNQFPLHCCNGRKEKYETTCECQTDMIVQHGHFPHGSRILPWLFRSKLLSKLINETHLQLQSSLLLYSQYYYILPPYSDGTGSLPYGFEGIFNLLNLMINARLLTALC